MPAHSEIPENPVSENIQLREGLEALEEVQARMDRISELVARYEAEE